tara:strand:- start:3421 stop:4041 length:621 start_codon:yes stop_codon:yes gene_type:complete
MLPEIIDAPITEEPMIMDNIDTEGTEKLNVEIQSDEEIIPEVSVKLKIDTEKVFQKPIVKPVVKVKREMSEERKKQLSDARIKANATRTANKEAKIKARDDANAEMDEMVKKKRDEIVEKRVSKLKAKVDKEPIIYQNNNISLDDIESITTKAISKYDIDRKNRKEEKRKKIAERDKHKKINNTIKRAQGGALNPSESGYFDNCFG